MGEIVLLPPRHGKSIKYNRISEAKAEDICSRRLRPTKPPTLPLTCEDCYYFNGKCEYDRNDGNMCVRYKNDITFSNRVHHRILNDYEWCLKHFDEFCELDKECFIAIYGKQIDDGLIGISKKKRGE